MVVGWRLHHTHDRKVPGSIIAITYIFKEGALLVLIVLAHYKIEGWVTESQPRFPEGLNKHRNLR